MRVARWIQLRGLATELFVVFVGLVAALQVDQWRERRELAETETRYLRRLSDDLGSYVAQLNSAMPFLEAHRRAVEHVDASFAAGRIVNGDTALFEAGLIYVAHLPSLGRARSAYDEMVASGVFARLRSSELQRSVSQLYATQSMVDENFRWWRAQPTELEAALQPLVEYYSDDSVRVPSPLLSADEGRRIRYDFEQLRSQRAIRNGYYWAADTHADWVEWSGKLLELAVAAQSIVATELQGR